LPLLKFQPSYLQIWNSCLWTISTWLPCGIKRQTLHWYHLPQRHNLLWGYTSSKNMQNSSNNFV